MEPTRRILAWVVLAGAGEAVAQIESVRGVERVARLTGEGALNDTNAVCVGGTDLGVLVEHDGRVWLYFGDTFSGRTPHEGGRWRHNVAAWTADETPGDGIAFGGWVTGDDGCARQVVVDPAEGQVTLIPTGGVSVGGSVYLWCMSVRHWGAPGEWDLNHARLYRSDDGRAFEPVEGTTRDGGTPFGMVGAALGSWGDPGDTYLYLLGTPGGRLGGVSVARVEASRVEDLDAYEYFAGADDGGGPTWGGDESDAVRVIPPTAGELSVFYAPDADRWCVLLFNHADARIELREAERPWGPWSAPMTVATAEEYQGLYGSYTCPRYVLDGGRTIYFTMSLWEPYDVYWMRAEVGLAGDDG